MKEQKVYRIRLEDNLSNHLYFLYRIEFLDFQKLAIGVSVRFRVPRDFELTGIYKKLSSIDDSIHAL